MDFAFFLTNAEEKCNFVISAGHDVDNWERIDSGEDERLGRLRCVGCHANRQNEITGTQNEGGWTNNFNEPSYTPSEAAQAERDRRGVDDDDLLDFIDSRAALEADFEAEKAVAENEACKCCEKVTLKIECTPAFAEQEKTIKVGAGGIPAPGQAGPPPQEPLCGTTWVLDCESKTWSKE